MSAVAYPAPHHNASLAGTGATSSTAQTPHSYAMSTLPSANSPAFQGQSRAPIAQQIPDKFKANNAWKTQGYPVFSEFLNSDRDFFVVRRFGKLNARVMLNM